MLPLCDWYLLGLLLSFLLQRALIEAAADFVLQSFSLRCGCRRLLVFKHLRASRKSFCIIIPRDDLLLIDYNYNVSV